MNPNGSAPSDNPFKGSRIFSLGHRNPQGLAFDRAGRLWAPEFGQNAFDEVNLIRAGRNYGWPSVEGRGTGGGRFISPKVVWRTDQASPSGAAIRGRNLYVAALQGETLFRIRLNGTSAGRPARGAEHPLRPHPHRGGGAGPRAVGGHVEPRRAGRPPWRGRQDPARQVRSSGGLSPPRPPRTVPAPG